MADLMEIIKSRRSIRAYAPDPVPDDTLEELLESMRWAPSAGNAQPVRIHIVKGVEIRGQIVQAALNQSFIKQAPVALVVAVDLVEAMRAYGNRGVDLYCLQDAAAAIQNLALLAHEKGLGTCWVGAFDEGRVAQILGLPRSQRPVAVVSLGVPAETPLPPPRKPLSIISFEHL